MLSYVDLHLGYTMFVGTYESKDLFLDILPGKAMTGSKFSLKGPAFAKQHVVSINSFGIFGEWFSYITT